MEEVEAKLEAEESKQRGHWRRTLQRFCTPVFLEALILTFLAGQQKLMHCRPAQRPPAIVQAAVCWPSMVQPEELPWPDCFAMLWISAYAPGIFEQQPVSAPVP